MLQAQLSTDLALACQLLAERQTPPQGSTGTRWTLDAGRWTLDAGRWTLDAGRWMLDAGRWMLDAGCWMLDLFDPSGCSSSPSASTDMCSGEAEVCDVGR